MIHQSAMGIRLSKRYAVSVSKQFLSQPVPHVQRLEQSVQFGEKKKKGYSREAETQITHKNRPSLLEKIWGKVYAPVMIALSALSVAQGTSITQDYQQKYQQAKQADLERRSVTEPLAKGWNGLANNAYNYGTIDSAKFHQHNEEFIKAVVQVMKEKGNEEDRRIAEKIEVKLAPVTQQEIDDAFLALHQHFSQQVAGEPWKKGQDAAAIRNQVFSQQAITDYLRSVDGFKHLPNKDMNELALKVQRNYISLYFGYYENRGVESYLFFEPNITPEKMSQLDKAIKQDLRRALDETLPQYQEAFNTRNRYSSADDPMERSFKTTVNHEEFFTNLTPEEREHFLNRGMELIKYFDQTVKFPSGDQEFGGGSLVFLGVSGLLTIAAIKGANVAMGVKRARAKEEQRLAENLTVLMGPANDPDITALKGKIMDHCGNLVAIRKDVSQQDNDVASFFEQNNSSYPMDKEDAVEQLYSVYELLARINILRDRTTSQSFFNQPVSELDMLKDMDTVIREQSLSGNYLPEFQLKHPEHSAFNQLQLPQAFSKDLGPEKDNPEFIENLKRVVDLVDAYTVNRLIGFVQQKTQLQKLLEQTGTSPEFKEQTRTLESQVADEQSKVRLMREWLESAKEHLAQQPVEEPKPAPETADPE